MLEGIKFDQVIDIVSHTVGKEHHLCCKQTLMTFLRNRKQTLDDGKVRITKRYFLRECELVSQF